MTDPADLTALRRAGVVAVLRAPSADAGLRAVDALVGGGVTGIEVTYSTPDAVSVIRRVRERYGDEVLLGAGTVLTAAQAEDAVEAGATFLVSPGTTPVLARAMVATGATVMLGALTPSELMTAVAEGAHVVKVFPASLGGPEYIRSLRGPFPDVALMPTGGVDPGNLPDWFAAGVVAVGAGSELCVPVAMAQGRFEELTDRATAFRAALEAVRA